MNFKKPLVKETLAEAFVSWTILLKTKKQYPLVLIISSLFSYFQRLMQYHALDNKKDAASVLGVSPYFIREYQEGQGTII